jgi:hypothetical protein
MKDQKTTENYYTHPNTYIMDFSRFFSQKKEGRGGKITLLKKIYQKWIIGIVKKIRAIFTIKYSKNFQ